MLNITLNVLSNQYTSPVLSLKPDDTIHSALFMMQKNDVKRIVIVEKSRPIGIVTERDIGKFLEHDKTTRSLNQIMLDEVMSQNVVTISSENHDIAMQSAIRMVTFQISSVIVIDNNGNMIGIITKSDLTKIFGNSFPKTYKVKDYMSRQIITCRKSDTLMFALDMLNRNKISRLIVTDNEGKPIGVITYDTFMRNSGFFKAEINSRSYLLPSITAKEMKVADLIGDELLTVEPEEDLASVAKTMTKFKISGIPVVDSHGSLEGLISSSDIVRALSDVETHYRLIKKDTHFD